jgi:DNA topoisomerase-1
MAGGGIRRRAPGTLAPTRAADAPPRTRADVPSDAPAATPADPAAAFDGSGGDAAPLADAPSGGASALDVRLDDTDRSLTADGQLKWKVPPPGVEIFENESGRGAWIEKWKSPKTGKWVHNYTAAHMETRSQQKFVANRRFGQVVGDIRAQLAADLGRDGTKKQVLALVVTLIDQAYFRVGNEESDDNGVYGVTTLLNRHVNIGTAGKVEFEYVGKKSVEQHRVVVDKKLARILKRLKAKAGGDDGRLFQFNGGAIDAGDVNAYLKKFGVTAKNFRTFHATRLIHEQLSGHGDAPKAEREAIVTQAFEHVAALLGHSPAVCRTSYVDPKVVDTFMRAGGGGS